MKKILLGAALAVTAIFTACDDNSSSSNVAVASCDINMSFMNLPVHGCIETADMSNPEQECLETIGEHVGTDNVSFGAGCPAGAKKSCPFVYDDAHINVLVYDDVLANQPCEKIKDLF